MGDISLKQKTVKNISWVFVSQMFVRIFSIASRIIIIRILNPFDFGIVAIAGILITMLQRFETLGINTAVVYESSDSEEIYATALTLILISIILFIVAFLMAPFWKNLYGYDQLTKVVRILAVVFIISCFYFTQDTYLTKTLNFKKKALPTILSKSAYALFTVIFALIGFGYWSLVLGMLVQELTKTLAYFILAPIKLKISFNKSIAKNLIGYGKWVVLTSILHWGYSYIDNGLIGKILGPAMLGYYVIAYRWSKWTAANIQLVIAQVLFPTYSRIRHELRRLRKSYLEVLKYNSLLVFPINLGFLFLGDSFVIEVLGAKWEPSISPLRILAIGGLFLSSQGAASSLFLALGKPKINTYAIGITFSIITILIYPSILWKGLTGASIVVTVAFSITTIYIFRMLSKMLQIPRVSILKIFIIPFFSCLISGLTILLIENLLGIKSFLLLLMIWTLSYLVLIGIFSKGRIFIDIKNLLSLVSRTSG